MDEINYDAMGKEALRQEMRDRELSYSKMNNEQMREALRADDKSHEDFVNGDGFEASERELAQQTVRQDVQQAKGAIELTDADRAAIASEAQARRTQPTPSTPQPRASRAGLKIEANREERNGVKRPSAGGVCRAVWDFCDTLQAAGGATAKQVREAAPGKGWNPNNAMIEFYQWRKFNGITGRAK